MRAFIHIIVMLFLSAVWGGICGEYIADETISTVAAMLGGFFIGAITSFHYLSEEF